MWSIEELKQQVGNNQKEKHLSKQTKKNMRNLWLKKWDQILKQQVQVLFPKKVVAHKLQ